MDPIRNPYAPGAGQRPPELAGRDRELRQFEVTLERVAAGRPDRSMVLSGLRGVGKTVLLNALRSLAVKRAWGTGKIEARPDQSLRLPLAQAVHAAVREVAHRHRDPDRVDAGGRRAQVVRAAHRAEGPQGGGEDRAAGSRRSTSPATKGRADSGDLELDLIELFTDVASLAGDLGVGIALFVDEMQDIPAPELAAVCGACHEISQQGAPLIVVGAGLPHLPVALVRLEVLRRAALPLRGRSTASPREMAERAWTLPAASEDVDLRAQGARRALPDDRRLPLLRAGLRQGHLGRGRRLPDHLGRRDAGRPRGRGRARRRLLRRPLRPGHPAERDYMVAMADLGEGTDDLAVSTADVARLLDRKPQSLSPARDGLIKKGLVFSGERGTVAFTVPHFGKFLRSQR